MKASASASIWFRTRCHTSDLVYQTGPPSAPQTHCRWMISPSRRTETAAATPKLGVAMDSTATFALCLLQYPIGDLVGDVDRRHLYVGDLGEAGLRGIQY
jgi:hypothetical protein